MAEQCNHWWRTSSEARQGVAGSCALPKGHAGRHQREDGICWDDPPTPYYPLGWPAFTPTGEVVK